MAEFSLNLRCRSHHSEKTDAEGTALQSPSVRQWRYPDRSDKAVSTTVSDYQSDASTIPVQIDDQS